MNLIASSDHTPETDLLCQELLDLELRLHSNIPTTLWISDLHGEGDRFASILKGRFGMLYQTLKEALPEETPEEHLQFLSQVIRKKHYYSQNALLTYEETIHALVAVIRYKLKNVDYDFKQITLPEYRNHLRRLVMGLKTPPSLFEHPVVAGRLIFHLCHTVKQVLLDHIIVLGDIFDRGAQPDKIIRILASKAYRNSVELVLGNHDILWMGAAAGAESLVIEALRITCRYDHFELMSRLGFDLKALEDFSVRTYPVEKVTGKFKAKTNAGRSMEKALTLIQFKLEDALIKRRPEYQMHSRLILPELARLLKTGETQGLNDTHFPTINLEAPETLTPEESALVEDLCHQFLNNTQLKRLLEFFFEKGKTYHIHNNLLNIHALVPSTDSGEFETFLGRKGKALLDFIQASIERSGRAYLAGQPANQEDRDLYFYLWCGPKSPFFGKEAMKTYERYFLVDKETHAEPSLFWKKNLQTDAFKQKLLVEFNAKRVIFGHTPVNIEKGHKMASEDGVAINVDGGFAAAYYHRGHALVHTPHQLYGIILPTPEEIESAHAKHESVPLSIELIDTFPNGLCLKDTYLGEQLQIRIQHLKDQLAHLA